MVIGGAKVLALRTVESIELVLWLHVCGQESAMLVQAGGAS
jgi:hypothetical protein